MFDKRIIGLAPQAFRLVVASVAACWVALVAHVGALACAAWLLGGALDGAPGADICVLLAGLACAALFGVASVAARRLAARASGAAKLSLRTALYRKLFELGPALRETVGAQEASQLLGEGVEKLDAYVGRYVPQLFYAVLAPLTLFAVAAVLYLPAALVMLVCVPLIPVSIALFMKRAKTVMGQYWDSYVDLGAEFLDAVRGLTTLIVFRADDAAQLRLRQRAEAVRQATMRLLRVQLNSVLFMDLFTYCGTALGTLAALLGYVGGAVGMWQFLLVCLLAVEFFLPMRTLGSYFHTGMGAQVVVDRIKRVLGEPAPARGTAALSDRNEVGLSCEGLGFSYGQGGLALDGVDLTVEPGSYVGITGVSGSGKSTLAQLLSGRLHGYAGSVRVGGVELADLDPDELRAAVVYVGASSHVFHGSVRSNLQLGCEDASDARMWEALKRCRLQAEVLAMGGLDAEVGEGGSNLSGGQRQRLCVARALLRDAAAYVFDEATSAVDAQSEEAILALVQELALTKTVVLVSHRLAALKWTDEVYVLDAGRVAEHGEHACLLAAGGRYAQLWAQQAELERFADAAARGVLRADQKKAPGPVVTPLEERAMAQMPDSVAQIMRMAIENKPVREAIAGAPLAGGHPSWIPRGPGDVRPEGVGGAGTGGVGVGGMQAVVGVDGAGAGEMRAAAGVGGAGADGAPAVPGAGSAAFSAADTSAEKGEAPAARPHRSVLGVLGGLVRVTRGQFGALSRAVGWGLLALACAAAIPLVAVACGAGAFGPVGTGTLVGTCAVALACGLLRGPVRYRERLGTHDQAFRTLALIRDRVFAAMRRLAPAKLQGRDAGDLVSLLTCDVELLEGFYARTLAPAAVALLGALVCLVAVGALAPAMLPVCLVGFAAVGVVAPIAGNALVEEEGRAIRERAVFMTAFMLDGLMGMDELLQFGRASRRSEEMEERMGQAAGEEGCFGLKSATAGTLGATLALLAVPLAAYAAARAGEGSALPAVLACVAFASVLEPLVQVSEFAAGFHQVLAAGGRVLDVLEEEPETPEVPRGAAAQAAVDTFAREVAGPSGALAGTPAGRTVIGADTAKSAAVPTRPSDALTPAPAHPFTGAALRDVDFSYRTAASDSEGGPRAHEALRRANLEARPGDIVAVTGRSGSGKSTMLKLLMRFWDADSGRVEVSGRDVRSIPTSELRAMVGYLEQSTYLFCGTVRDNIALVRQDATDEQVMRAVHAASLDDFVAGLPQGLDTPLAGGGAGVSDGERQRIGLARLFLYDAPLNLLDEPTSNLDTVNEAAVMRSVLANHEGRTFVVVSHRRSVSAIADVVYEMGG